jgi:hypothetical protein
MGLECRPVVGSSTRGVDDSRDSTVHPRPCAHPLAKGRSPRSRQRPPLAHSAMETYHRRVVHDTTKGERRAARERVSGYYESELAKLIDRVEEALTRYRDGEINAHDVDDVIHRYSKATRALWRFCWSTGSGSQVILVARTLEHWAAESDAIDWWDEAERPRRRRR